MNRRDFVRVLSITPLALTFFKHPELHDKNVDNASKADNLSQSLESTGKQTFKNFKVTEANKSVYLASLQLAKLNSSSSSLFLYGPSKTGKTHLANAIKNRLHATLPHYSAKLIHSELLINQFVRAVRKGNIESFRKAYTEKIDVLIIEDVHFLSHAEAVQKEAIYIIENLVRSGKPVVFTSNKKPNSLSKLEPGLLKLLERSNLQFT